MSRSSKLLVALGIVLNFALAGFAAAQEAPVEPAAVVEQAPEPTQAAAVEVPQEPTHLEDAIKAGMKLVDLKKAGQWWAFTLVIVQIVMFVLKQLEVTGVLVKKNGGAIVMALGAVAGILASVVGGASLMEAILLFIGTGGTAVINDLLHQLGILKHSRNPDGTLIETPPAA